MNELGKGMKLEIIAQNFALMCGKKSQPKNGRKATVDALLDFMSHWDVDTNLEAAFVAYLESDELTSWELKARAAVQSKAEKARKLADLLARQEAAAQARNEALANKS